MIMREEIAREEEVASGQIHRKNKKNRREAK